MASVVYLKKVKFGVKLFRILFAVVFLLTVSDVSAQSSGSRNKSVFQKNRRAFQKANYQHKTKKYAGACEIFEKKRTKGGKKGMFSFLALGGKKKKTKLAEQE